MPESSALARWRGPCHRRRTRTNSRNITQNYQPALWPSRPPPRSPRPAAVVFALDGTLVDSAPALCGALNRLLVEHGRAPLELAEVRLMVGDGAATMIKHGFAVRDG